MQLDAQPSARRVRFLSFIGDSHVDVVAALDDPQTLRSRNTGPNFAGERTFFVAELQGSKSARVKCNVSIDRIGVKGLAKHQSGLLVLVACFREETDIGSQRSE